MAENRSTKNRLGGQESILFIDDEEALVFTVKNNLELLGYDVVGETQSNKALDLLKQAPKRYDLVITDMAMPEMTGEELVKAIQKIRPDIPIIICTGYSEKINEDQLQKMGIQAFLLKPFFVKEMATLIRQVMDKKNTKPITS